VVLIGALIVGVRYIINRIAAIEIRLNRAEARATLAETRLNLTWKRARRTEARLHRVQGELARTRNIVGLPSVEAVVQGVRAQLNTDLHEIGDRFEERFSDLEMILDGAEVLITAPVPTAEGLLGAGDNLKLVKSQIESLRKSFIGDRGAVSQRLEPGFVTLAVLDQRLLHNWLMLHRARMWKAASTTRQRFDTDLTSLLERLGILEAQRVEAMRTLRESLRTQNTVDNRSVRERRKDITALKEELGED